MRQHGFAPFDSAPRGNVIREPKAPALGRAVKCQRSCESGKCQICDGARHGLRLATHDSQEAKKIEGIYAESFSGRPSTARAMVRDLFKRGYDADNTAADANGAWLGSGLPSGSTPRVDSMIRRAGEVIFSTRWTVPPERRNSDKPRAAAKVLDADRQAMREERAAPIVSGTRRKIIEAIAEASQAGLAASLHGDVLNIGCASVKVPSAHLGAVRALLGHDASAADGAATVKIACDLQAGDECYHAKHGDGIIESIYGHTAKVLFEESNRVLTVFLRDIA